MIEPLQRKTKVIGSLNSQAFQDALPSILQEKDIGALRILYSPSAHDALIRFLETRRSGSTPNPLHAKTPLLLDFCSHSPTKFIGEGQFLPVGEEFRLVPQESKKKRTLRVECDMWDLVFTPGIYLYLGSGGGVLSVESASAQEVLVRVIREGSIRTGELLYNLDFFSTHQAQFLSALFALPSVDYVILPATLDKKVLNEVIETLAGRPDGNASWILLHVDSQESAIHLPERLPLVKGIVISRLQVALTGNPASVPIFTKKCTQLCNEYGKIIIVASETLASMKTKPTPTRAEVSDIANSVIDGVDGVLLTEELLTGNYPERAIQVCKDIIDDLEDQGEVGLNWNKKGFPILNVLDAVSFHSYQTALRVGAKAIVCITHQGNTALRLASFRPKVPIVAVTFSSAIAQKLSLIRGVVSITLDGSPNLDSVLPNMHVLLKNDLGFTKGDKIVFVSVSISSMGVESSNLFTVQEIE